MWYYPFSLIFNEEESITTGIREGIKCFWEGYTYTPGSGGYIPRWSTLLGFSVERMLQESGLSLKESRSLAKEVTRDFHTKLSSIRLVLNYKGIYFPGDNVIVFIFNSDLDQELPIKLAYRWEWKSLPSTELTPLLR